MAEKDKRAKTDKSMTREEALAARGAVA